MAVTELSAKWLALRAMWAAAILVAAASSVGAFQLGVAPMRFEVALGARPETRALKVVNQGATDMDIALRVANFTLNEANHVVEIASTPESLDQWIIIRPLKFTLKAGETRTIRLAIRPLSRPRRGEHRAVIFIERTDKRGLKQDKLNVGFRFGVVVYAHVGERLRRSRLHGLSVAKDGLALDIESTGNSHARVMAAYGIWPESAFPGATIASALIARSEFIRSRNYTPKGAVVGNLLPDTPVLPGSRRTVRAAFKPELPPGRYRALVRGHIGETPLERVIAFQVGDRQ